MMGYGMMGYGWGVFMMIGIFILIVLGIIALIRYIQQPAKSSSIVSKSALDILNERYAKGEISEDEYQRKKKDMMT